MDVHNFTHEFTNTTKSIQILDYNFTVWELELIVALYADTKAKKKFPVITNAEDILFDTDCGSSLELVLIILMSSENERWKPFIFSLIFSNVESQEYLIPFCSLLEMFNYLRFTWSW